MVEPGVVQLQAEGVREADTAAHHLGRLMVRQIEEELQDADGGGLARRQSGPPVTGIPVGEVLVTPQPVEAVSYPHRRRATRVARPRDLRGQRHLLTGTRTERQRTPRHLHGLVEHPEHAHRSPQRTGELQDHRQSQAQDTSNPPDQLSSLTNLPARTAVR